MVEFVVVILAVYWCLLDRSPLFCDNITLVNVCQPHTEGESDMLVWIRCVGEGHGCV